MWCTDCGALVDEGSLTCSQCGSAHLGAQEFPEGPRQPRETQVPVEYRGNKYIVVFRGVTPTGIIAPGFSAFPVADLLFEKAELQEIYALALAAIRKQGDEDELSSYSR